MNDSIEHFQEILFMQFSLTFFSSVFIPNTSVRCAKMWKSNRQVYDDSEKGLKRERKGNVFPEKIPTVDACETIDIFIMFPWLFNGNRNTNYEYDYAWKSQKLKAKKKIFSNSIVFGSEITNHEFNQYAKMVW